jgi:hypothetical protein
MEDSGEESCSEPLRKEYPEDKQKKLFLVSDINNRISYCLLLCWYTLRKEFPRVIKHSKNH